jgi:hypothetical protein
MPLHTKQTVYKAAIRELLAELIESIASSKESTEFLLPGPSTTMEEPYEMNLAMVSSPESSDTDDEWEVDHVVNHRVSRGIYLYKLRWKGFGPDADTWHQARLIPGCCQLIIQYWERIATMRRRFFDDEAHESRSRR